MNVPWDAAAGAAIGADWLLAAIAPAGDFGRRARAGENAFRCGDEAVATAALARVTAISQAVPPERLTAIVETIAAAPDPGAALAVCANGGTLDDADFFELSRFLDTLSNVAALTNETLLHDVAPRDAAHDLRAELALGRTPERTFYLADAFSVTLADARSSSAVATARYDIARSCLAARVARYAGLEHVRDGEFVLLRERFVPPLLPEIRVLREAPTYVLCELALDDAALRALGERDAAGAEVAAAEERVRVHLTARVAQHAPALEHACRALGALDVLVARAAFAQRFACTVPQIASSAEAALEDARYLPLADALAARGRAYEPISFELEGLGIISGANMGGKTAALRTLGFCVACAALGVPVPARHATLPLVDEIAWLGLGDVRSEDGLLSSFGTEVIALRSFLERGSRRPLVLIDEFARTTSPREGRALLIALVELLRARGALGFAATHFEGIAAGAGAPHYAVGGIRDSPSVNGTVLELDAALELIAAATDYRLLKVEEGAVPDANALTLAAALGLDAALVSRARMALQLPAEAG